MDGLGSCLIQPLFWRCHRRDIHRILGMDLKDFHKHLCLQLVKGTEFLCPGSERWAGRASMQPVVPLHVLGMAAASSQGDEQAAGQPWVCSPPASTGAASVQPVPARNQSWDQPADLAGRRDQAGAPADFPAGWKLND